MKKAIMFCIAFLILTSCGKRGKLEPYEKEEVPYPRQYPQQNNQLS